MIEMEKESYINQQNHKEKTGFWSKELEKIRENRNTSLNFKNTALLILDMQNYFSDEKSHAFIPSIGFIIPQIRKIMDKLIQNGGKIVFTRHISSKDGEDNMNRWWKGKILEEFSAITPELDTGKGKVIDKHKYSAFYSTNLDEILRGDGIEKIIITGVMTHLCCETTARDGFMRNYDIFCIMDAMATYNEDFHLNSLKAIAHGFGVCMTSEEFLNWPNQ